MGEPLVSVIVPVFNAERTLPRLMETLLSQTLAPIEIILVDNHSSDGSLACALRYAGLHAHVRVMTAERRSGAGGSRNVGIEVARGKYVAFADADDSVLPDMVERLYDAAETSSAEMAVCGVRLHSDTAERDVLPSSVLTPQSLASDRRLVSCVWNKLVRRDWLCEQEVFFPAGLRCAEDAAFMLKLLSRGPRIASVTAPLYRYMIHGAGLSGAMKARNDVLEAMEDVRSYIEKNPPLIPFREIFRHAVFMHVVYHPCCMLLIDSLWHGRRRWKNLIETPEYIIRTLNFFIGYFLHKH